MPLQGKSVCLMGPPGSGKSSMIAKYATKNEPVHFVDIDRKVMSCGLLREFVTSWEVAEALSEDNLVERVKAMVENRKPKSAPMGWLQFAKLVDQLPKDPEAMRAKMWGIDSVTRLVDHLKRLLLHLDSRGAANLSPRNYGALLGMMEETTAQLIDVAKAHDKIIVVTVHERVSEIPGPNTKVMNTKDSQGNVQRDYIGPMDMKITPSIEGQFSQKMLSYFDEAYALYVEMVNGKPVWKCRVMPDGMRDLRTTAPVAGRMDFPCDFREIWKDDTTKNMAPTVEKRG